jgi:ABC-type cobalamin transport system ATPase subunit
VFFIKLKCYPVGMITSQLPSTSIEPKAGRWLLLVGPRSMNTTMLSAIARLGERGDLRVLDGGNRFNAYPVARAARGRPEILNRITVSRAFTCYQVLSLLESAPAVRIPFVVLDMLNTFYDESVQVGERKRLLRACITHLKRLERSAGGVVTVHPPAVPSPAAQVLWEILQAAAADSYFIQDVVSSPEQMRFF